jgi:D-tyrosyl-tRNA(Tyr) deacylase
LSEVGDVLKVLVQRVIEASVSIGGELIGVIGRGLVVFVGVAQGDMERDAIYLADKVVNLRIFPDKLGRFNISALESNGEMLLVSQFTLLADTRKGRRPSFVEAAPPSRQRPCLIFSSIVCVMLVLRWRQDVFNSIC